MAIDELLTFQMIFWKICFDFHFPSSLDVHLAANVSFFDIRMAMNIHKLLGVDHFLICFEGDEELMSSMEATDLFVMAFCFEGLTACIKIIVNVSLSATKFVVILTFPSSLEQLAQLFLL